LRAAEFQNVTQTYHHDTVLENINMKIDSGVFAVIFGPPGCGKSVLLRLLTGLETPTEGKIFMREEDVTGVPSGERSIGYVPQSFALYPHFKVYENISYPLRLIGAKKAEIDEAVKRAAHMLRITPLLEKYPDQLSGGEKQRVALARGITKKTGIYVFDDPLSGLDFKLREQLIDDLKEMQEALGATFIYTTSDTLEAMILAEQIFILDGGRILEHGSLEDMYYTPGNIRTMELLGFPEANVLNGELLQRDGSLICKTKLFDFPVKPEAGMIVKEEHREVFVGIRPQDMKPGLKRQKDTLSAEARIILKEDLGGEFIVHLDVNGLRLLSFVRQDDLYLLSDEEITIGIPMEEIVIFSSEDGTRIGRGGG